MQSLSGTERRARGVLAGGCDSPVRSGWGVGAPMFVQSSARGAYAFDEDGRRYVDYVMAYGPLLFGHTHPALVAGLDDLARHGFVWGSTHAEEVRLAERVRRHLPSMQRMRFVTTGTEAMMSAIRVARAFTRRNRVLKFAGNYHGHFDLALLDAGASAHTTDSAASGIPSGVVRDVAVVRYNDLGSVDAFLREHADDVAAIAVEPIVANMGYVAPQPGFLEGLRERADRCGALLIFDEVITWLRFGLSGAQGRAAVAPDLTALGKIMGGGTPIAAFGGREDVMGVLAPDGAAFTGGTHGGNPFCVGMAHRVLDLLESHPEYYAYLDGLARRLADGIRAIFTERNLPYAVVQRE
ncbi:MAG: aminotransferase class III-fold pyridoxal phosphate-dependent enzyme, partial [Candidatus Eremiobacteraeota bacterium]|nr:aminotransferase class III-fold pyridoxal phosphate-dependent enzyme [Candidatus Eremiobacteraeota bacterium]